MPTTRGYFSPRTVRICIVFPILAMSLFAAYLSFRWALADILSIQVRHQLGKAQMIGQSLSKEQWRQTRSWLDQTLSLHPNYSSHLEMAALFYQVVGEQSESLLNELGWQDSQKQALDYSRRAAWIRPTWPYFWNELFLNKVELNQFDSELTGAVERAVNLGPWEEAVQFDAAFTGLDYWDQLQPAAHPWVILAMDKILLMKKNQQSLIDELKAHPNMGKLCRSLTPALISQYKIGGRYCEE